jgi:hypothetical protein
MDTPRVALRFREITPNIDTISEHRKIKDSEGAVWWGWWRKEFEPDHHNLFADLASKGGGYVLLVDRQTERCFEAHYLQAIANNNDAVDLRRIPAYYREQKANVSGWFLLDEIKDINYRSDIATRLGQSTLLILDGSEKLAADDHADLDSTPMKRPGILHLSDLHFGDDYSFLQPDVMPVIGEQRHKLTKSLVEDLERADLLKSIGLLLVTGDFTTQGDWSDLTRNRILQEFESLRKALELPRDCVMAIPGNHDIIRYKEGEKVDVSAIAAAKQTTYHHERDYRTFLEELTGRGWREPLNYYRKFRHADFELVIAALNSCTITATEWTEYGYVGELGVSVLNEVGRMKVQKPTFRLMALHHHVVPVYKVEAPNKKGVSLTLDAVDILDAGQRAGFHFLVHGHQHLARISKYARVPRKEEAGQDRRDIYIISGGSSGAIVGRLPGSERNTYSLILPKLDTTHLIMRELRTDAQPGAVLYDCKLEVEPLQP